MKRALTYVSALAVAAGMTAAPAMAQNDTDQQMQSEGGASQAESATAKMSEDQAPASEAALPDADAEKAGDKQTDRLIATVGDGEIRQSDVLATIETLPAGVQQTPPQMLLPAVVDQLIMRRLIVEEARAEGLESDSQVQDLVDSSSDSAMEQALVEVWLQREMGERVTDEDVQTAVDELKAHNPDMGESTPGLTQQVRQSLQVQAMTDISDELLADADITFYDPDGQPVDESEQVGSGAEGESQTKKMQPQTDTQSQN